MMYYVTDFKTYVFSHFSAVYLHISVSNAIHFWKWDFKEDHVHCSKVSKCTQRTDLIMVNYNLYIMGKLPMSDQYQVSCHPTSTQPHIFKVEYHHETIPHSHCYS